MHPPHCPRQVGLFSAAGCTNVLSQLYLLLHKVDIATAFARSHPNSPAFIEGS